MQIGRGWIKSSLHPQRYARRARLLQLGAQFGFTDDFRGALLDVSELFVDGREGGHLVIIGVEIADLRFQIADFKPFAVRKEATKMETNSFASFSKGPVLSARATPLSTRSSSPNRVSSASSSTMPSFDTKSAFDRARHTAR